MIAVFGEKPEPDRATVVPTGPAEGAMLALPTAMVIEPLNALGAVQELRTAVTLYEYEPGTTPVSSQAVGVTGSSEVGELPQAGLAVAPTNRCT